MSKNSFQETTWDESMSLDAKDFGPYWLEGVQGSLAEERRKSNSRKAEIYNSKVKAARSYNRANPLKLRDYLNNPELLNIKLSALWSLYPSLEIRFSLDVSNLCRRSSKLLRNFLIYFYKCKKIFPQWIQFEIELEFDRLLEGEDHCPISPQLLQELKAIRHIFLVLEETEANIILENLYSEENLKHWVAVGKSLVDNYQGLIQIPYARLKPKVRRRGYRESHANKRKSRDQRLEVAMSQESRSIEEIKASILKKQALLFEKRLDEYLRLADQDIPIQERKETFRAIITESVPKSSSSEEIQDEIQRNLYLSKGDSVE